LYTKSGYALEMKQLTTPDGRVHNVPTHISRQEAAVSPTGTIMSCWRFCLNRKWFTYSDHGTDTAGSLAPAIRMLYALYKQPKAVISIAWKARHNKDSNGKNVNTYIAGCDAAAVGDGYDTGFIRFRTKVKDGTGHAIKRFPINDPIAALSAYTQIAAVRRHVPTDRSITKAEMDEIKSLVFTGKIVPEVVKLPKKMMTELAANRDRKLKKAAEKASKSA